MLKINFGNGGKMSEKNCCRMSVFIFTEPVQRRLPGDHRTIPAGKAYVQADNWAMLDDEKRVINGSTPECARKICNAINNGYLQVL